MQVFITIANLVGHDAIGQCVIQQARTFLRRGDQVTIVCEVAPVAVDSAIAALVRVTNHAQLSANRLDAFWRGDLYVFHYPGLYSLMDTLPHLDRGAVIFYYHNVTPPELWGNDEVGAWCRRSIDAIAGYVRFADLCVTDSDFNTRDLIDNHRADPERTLTLSLSIPLDRFVPGPRDPDLLTRYGALGKRIILFVGRMAPNKRVDLLVEAMPLVLARVPDALLLLVGDDRGNDTFKRYVSGMKARAAELGIGRQVHFSGVVDDLPAHMRLADVYASASLHEGFGVPLVEAMACGTPVVVSNATAHPWVLGEAGLLCEPGDARDLADKLIAVLTDDALHGTLVNRGLARAQDFAPDRYDAEWARIISRAVVHLPRQPYPDLMAVPAHSLQTVFGRPAQTAEQPASETGAESMADVQATRTRLRGHILHLDNTADVMKRGYVVRSNAPLVGKLIAWIRRNLTSHLREPYLDPMIEKQVAFNHHVSYTLHQMLDAMMAIQARLPADGRSDEQQRALARLADDVAALKAAVDTASPSAD